MSNWIKGTYGYFNLALFHAVYIDVREDVDKYCVVGHTGQNGKYTLCICGTIEEAEQFIIQHTRRGNGTDTEVARVK